MSEPNSPNSPNEEYIANDGSASNGSSEYDYESDSTIENNGNRNEITEDLPTYQRLLLSLDECGKIFGPQGQFLRKIKTDNSVKIDITEKQAGCSDRILTCAGSIKNISNAIKNIVELLITNQPEETKKYPFYFLNSFLPIPHVSDFDDISSLSEIYNIRIILTNTQISSIIGKQGKTIKNLVNKYNVKLVASRNFLPDSDERILQIQGTPDSISQTALEVSKIVNSEINIDQITEKHYFPHSLLHTENHENTKNHQFSRHERSSNTKRQPVSDAEFTATVLIPDALVGAMMGTRGNRISNLRKFTHTRIDTGKSDNPSSSVTDDEGDKFRKFVISGDKLDNVKKAENLLVSNLDSEVKRREELEAND